MCRSAAIIPLMVIQDSSPILLNSWTTPRFLERWFWRVTVVLRTSKNQGNLWPKVHTESYSIHEPSDTWNVKHTAASACKFWLPADACNIATMREMHRSGAPAFKLLGFRCCFGLCAELSTSSRWSVEWFCGTGGITEDWRFPAESRLPSTRGNGSTSGAFVWTEGNRPWGPCTAISCNCSNAALWFSTAWCTASRRACFPPFKISPPNAFLITILALINGSFMFGARWCTRFIILLAPSISCVSQGRRPKSSWLELGTNFNQTQTNDQWLKYWFIDLDFIHSFMDQKKLCAKL